MDDEINLKKEFNQIKEALSLINKIICPNLVNLIGSDVCIHIPKQVIKERKYDDEDKTIRIKEATFSWRKLKTVTATIINDGVTDFVLEFESLPELGSISFLKSRDLINLSIWETKIFIDAKTEVLKPYLKLISAPNDVGETNNWDAQFSIVDLSS